jgi:protoporphyrin/coproporphyrin ferrochelatase
VTALCKEKILLVSFGGPRNLEEVSSFLQELLCDKEVLRTKLPQFLHSALFRPIAKRRAKKVAEQYKEIGGKSPLFEETEELGRQLSSKLSQEVICFHRYLPETHKKFIQAIHHASQDATSFKVFPLYPQFSFSTTGSSALWLKKNLSKEVVEKLFWIKSYPDHLKFIETQKILIEKSLKKHGFKEEETILLFSCHGLPKRYVTTGDIYEKECQISFEEVKKQFPKALCKLCYQSKFGPGEWLKPYTLTMCKEILNWCEGKKNVLFIPLSFTSDHLETLYEVECEYLPIITKKGLNAYRTPAMGLENTWIEAMCDITKNSALVCNKMLLRLC